MSNKYNETLHEKIRQVQRDMAQAMEILPFEFSDFEEVEIANDIIEAHYSLIDALRKIEKYNENK